MAGTVTAVRTPRLGNNERKFEKIVISWTSDASGDATLSIANLYGWLVKVVTDPGAAAPTDDYDITLVDENSADAAQGLLANRDTTNTETVYTFVSGAPTPVLLCGTHIFTVANAGAAKNGTCTLYIAECL